MQVDYHPTGIHLPQIGLWLDSREPAPVCWVSHAHSDHARGGHGRTLASQTTLNLMKLREDPALVRGPMEALPDREWFDFGPARLQSIPCAHVCGSRQLLVDFEGERLLYTGDIKLKAALLGDQTEIPKCDHLIIESTFGLPIYSFLSAPAASERIVAFARQCINRGEVPVFLGYGLGRGQEICHVLTNAGVPVLVHGAIAKLIPAHEALGYRFPGWEPYAPGNHQGKALVVVAGFKDHLQASGRSYRFACVSGWAALSRARAQMDVEELIPYSDHGDFSELLAMVEQSGARRVDVIHGYTEAFAKILKAKGLDARAVREGNFQSNEDLA